MPESLAREILERTGEHVVLVAIALLVACLRRHPGGRSSSRDGRRGAGVVLGFTNVAQTIPSLALFGFLIPLPFIGGIGKRTAIVALVLYALLPILRNTLTGILGVDPAVVESAVAMGMTDRQRLFQVELPLAAPTILAGLRIAAVTTIGTATIAAAIGGGGLGVFIFRGLASVDSAADPRGRGAGGAPRARRSTEASDGSNGVSRASDRLLSPARFSPAGCARPRALVVGSKNFTEQEILGEIAAQQLERRLGAPVTRKLDIGGTLLAHEALLAGDIDLYPEYTGTALTAVLKLPAATDPTSRLRDGREGIPRRVPSSCGSRRSDSTTRSRW